MSTAPEAFLPESYALTMIESFAASCGTAALVLVLEDQPEEEAAKIKETIITAWKKTWRDKFQRDMEEYNRDLADSKTTKTEHFPQPEEYQLGFNRALASAEKTARISIGAETKE